MKSLILAAIAAVMALMGSNAHADAAETSAKDVADGFSELYLTGKIEIGDYDRLMATAQSAVDRGRRISGLRLNSPGGKVVEAVKIATSIHNSKWMWTMVEKGADCWSACFFIFAAGVHKYSQGGSSIGVHSASIEGKENWISQSSTLEGARFLNDLGVPDRLIVKMISAKPDEMYYLTFDDAAAMDITFIEAPATVASPAPPAPPATTLGAQPEWQPEDCKGSVEWRDGTPACLVKGERAAAPQPEWQPEDCKGSVEWRDGKPACLVKGERAAAPG
jgi:hypothetical protein